jgi:hypothetical protein
MCTEISKPKICAWEPQTASQKQVVFMSQSPVNGPFVKCKEYTGWKLIHRKYNLPPLTRHKPFDAQVNF